MRISKNKNMLDMPYFMENDEWYYFDGNLKKYVLTDKAPEKAKESYEEFNRALNEQYPDSINVTIVGILRTFQLNIHISGLS